ncbi:MAG: protease, partial [Calditrichales bacterium]
MTRFLLMCALLLPVFAGAQGVEGYYRYPAIHDNFILFTAEGDLWKVGDEGGLAQRLTTHPGKETNAAISQDGKWVAYSAEYEGPTEVYVMPVAGGIPIRCTFEGETAIVVGWTPQSQVLYTTQKYSGLPNWVLATYDLEKKKSELLPLYQANDGNYNPQDNTLFFTRLPFQGSRTKRYVGGTAQNIWKFPPAGPEALSLTADYSGTSKNPMYWDGRVYYISDQDGTMNLWSMNTSGADRMQHTFHSGMDIANPCLQNGRIVYQQVADIFIYDIASATDKKLRITLVSDFDQKREKWVQSPMDYLSSASISPDGDRAVLISRGQVFIFP